MMDDAFRPKHHINPAPDPAPQGRSTFSSEPWQPTGKEEVGEEEEECAEKAPETTPSDIITDRGLMLEEALEVGNGCRAVQEEKTAMFLRRERMS
uniref:Uncharacterized protein n=1 Tax=Knipowitschia caucasica TaxID=637954 RepID=A0AAV2ITM7_KNICA